MTEESTPSRRLRKHLANGRGGGRPAWGRVAATVTLAGVAAIALVLLAAVVVPLPRHQVARATVLYDANDALAAKLFVENRVPVPLSEVPVHLRQAFLAAEDDRFYRHFGIDPIGIARAIVRNLRAGRVVEGGSTITQQLARNLFLGHERTLTRKLKEVFITLQLEARYSKNEILEMYLNQIYFGFGAYGVEAASELYFNKPVRNLTLAESATLAGLPRGPELFSPFRNPEAARARRNDVLDRMAQVGYLAADAAIEAGTEPLVVAKRRPPARAAYFVDYVLREIRARYPDLEPDLYRGGYKIYTTMDNQMQEAAEKAFAEQMPPAKPDARGVPQPEGALVAIDPRNGFVKAMVGGRTPENPSNNRAVTAHRQPGSAFKPFLYAAVLSSGHTVTDRQVCDYVSFPGSAGEPPYVPTDYTLGGRRSPYHYRPMTVREAIEISDNVVAVKWAATVGPERIAAFASRLGIESPLEKSLPLALGTSEVTPLELATAYAPFANMGWRVKPMAIRRIVDADGRVIYENRPDLRKVLDEGVAYILTDIMKGVVTHGTAANLAGLLDRPAAGKTGTTDGNDNAWFVGYTPELVTAVWVGNDLPSPLPGYGSTLAGPIWARFVTGALAGRTVLDFPRPANVLSVAVSTADGLLPNPTSPTVDELFLAGTEPATVSPLYRWGGTFFGGAAAAPGGGVGFGAGAGAGGGFGAGAGGGFGAGAGGGFGAGAGAGGGMEAPGGGTPVGGEEAGGAPVGGAPVSGEEAGGHTGEAAPIKPR